MASANDNHGLMILSVSIAALALCYITVSLRVYVRVFIARAFSTDDVFALLSLLMVTVFLVFLLYGVANGLGKHSTTLTLQQISNALMAYLMAEIFYALATCFIKLSFCLTLLRIVNSRVQTWTIYAIMTVTVGFTAFFFFFTLLFCRPVSLFWMKVLTKKVNGTCKHGASIPPGMYAHGIFLIIADVTLAALPARMIWGLNMHPRAKLSVIALLMVGSIASVATVVRLFFVPQLASGKDFLFRNIDITIWSVVEVSVSIIATSISTLRPLAKKFNLFSLSHGSNNVVNYDWPGRGRSGSLGKIRISSFGGSAANDKGPAIAIQSLRGRNDADDHPDNLSVTMDGGKSSNGSREEILWHGGKHSRSLRSEYDDIETQSIPNGQIQKVVEFSTHTETRR